LSSKITIVIADDHPLFRKGLRQVIEAEAELEILGEAGDGRRALTLIRAHKLNIAIVDIAVPTLDGFDLVRAVRKDNLPAAIIFLTMYRVEGILKEALDLDFRGYVVKDSAITDIVSSINAVASGQHFTSPTLTTYLIKNARRTAVDSAKSNGRRPRQKFR